MYDKEDNNVAIEIENDEDKDEHEHDNENKYYDDMYKLNNKMTIGSENNLIITTKSLLNDQQIFTCISKLIVKRNLIDQVLILDSNAFYVDDVMIRYIKRYFNKSINKILILAHIQLTKSIGHWILIIVYLNNNKSVILDSSIQDSTNR